MKSKSTIIICAIINFVLILAVIACIIAIVVLAHRSNSDDTFKSNSDWRDSVCEYKKCPKSWDPLPVLMVSLDGFRADYLVRHLTPNIQRLIKCGTNATWMYPCYISVTFPNHYSIVTGLYPESHGIIVNVMYDPKIKPSSDNFFSLGKPSSLNPQWWGGEPLWNTVIKNGKKAATMFWPGSDVEIEKMRPTFYHLYNTSFPWTDRVNQVIKWLNMDDSERPSLVNLYFNQPDHTAHQYGPDSPQVNDELVHVDGIINYLMTELYRNDLLHCVNMIITADHGMQEMNRGQIEMDQFFDISDAFVFYGPVGRILRNGTSLTTKQITDSLTCKNQPYRVFPRQYIPRRLHYSRNWRIGDIIVDGDLGYLITPFHYNFTLLGDHGYDFRKNSMHALFIANGPSFKKGYTSEPFENIEIYNLVADLLKLNVARRAPNNGTSGSLNHLLRHEPSPPAPVFNGLPIKCSFDSVTKNCDCPSLLSNKAECSTKVSDTTTSFPTNICSLSTCMYSVFYDNVLNLATALQASVTSEMTIRQSPVGCNTIYGNEPINCTRISEYKYKLEAEGMDFYPMFTFTDKQNGENNLFIQKLALYRNFFNNFWMQLQILTKQYAERFGKILVMTGPVFDYNYDGLKDSEDIIKNYTKPGFPSIPTHVFHIILRCGQCGWNSDNLSCKKSNEAQVISFVLPNLDEAINCETPDVHFLSNTARIRDIEELTGLRFFTDTSRWPSKESVRQRIHINQKLW